MMIDPRVYRALSVSQGLRFYLATGKRINTLYTPKNMMRVAQDITGKTFAPRDYMGAAEALKAWAEKETFGETNNR